MNPEKSNHHADKSKRRFDGCVELVPVYPSFIEFVTAHRLWGIPIGQLESFILRNNPEADGKKTSPTDLLILVFKTRLVYLFGWRLEQMLDPLMQGRVRRIHAEKFLGTLMIGEPWISEIVVAPRYPTMPL